MAQENIRWASGHQGGVQEIHVLDFSKKNFAKAILSPDLLPFSSFEVWVKTEALVGAVGEDLVIASGPTKSVPDHADALGTITLADSGVGRLAGVFESSYISVTIPAAVVALNAGKMTIIITAKDS